MHKDEFRTWLHECKKMNKNTISSRLSNCKRIEKFEGNLDDMFMRDKLESIIGKLEYSSGKQEHSIPINGDVYNGTATLRSAVRLYQEFSGGFSPEKQINKSISRQPLRQRMKSTGEWPEWETPTSETVFKIVKMVTPFVRFLHPDIVKAIVEDNERNREMWREKLISNGVDPGIYLWDKSSCAFPGIRRYMGSKEIALYRKQIAHEDYNIPDALRLDDNSFPKHIWSFIFRGKQFQNYGPSGYSLAHLADHKDYKNRRDDEFKSSGLTPNKLYGLYSCVSNAVYMPNNIIRLSDFNFEVRSLLLNKANSMYSSVCNILPPAYQIKHVEEAGWKIGNFDWAEPVGREVDLDNFFEFRAKIIGSL